MCLRRRSITGKKKVNTDENYQVPRGHGLRRGVPGLRELCRRCALLHQGQSRRQDLRTRMLRQGYRRADEGFDGVDIVVGSAGVALGQGKIADSDPELWRKTIEINLIGAYHTAHAAIPYLRRRGGGKIIMIGSGHRKRPRAGYSAYSCSKSGLWMLIESLAVELQEDNISVNELIPGPVRTEMTRGLAPMADEWVKEPEDVAPIALFLAGLPNRGPSAQSFSLMRRA